MRFRFAERGMKDLVEKMTLLSACAPMFKSSKWYDPSKFLENFRASVLNLFFKKSDESRSLKYFFVGSLVSCKFVR